MKLVSIISAGVVGTSALAVTAQGTDPKTCAAIESDQARLACYDSIHRVSSSIPA